MKICICGKGGCRQSRKCVPEIGSLEFSSGLHDVCLEGKPGAILDEGNKIDHIAKELLN
ncbi:MAG: hypothetical protein JW833_05825 [Prolixibacteraceae bacterium]|nr:hypothetical protein [Prolixibacteraceae bacterium]